MKVEITYNGGLDSVVDRISGGFGEILAAGAQAVCDRAKELCPVDTGALQASITVSAQEDRAEISANTDYASYVEFGTSKMAAQPYLVPALLQSSDALLRAMTDAIANV